MKKAQEDPFSDLSNELDQPQPSEELDNDWLDRSVAVSSNTVAAGYFSYEGPISLLDGQNEITAIRLDGLADDPDQPWDAPTLDYLLERKFGFGHGRYGDYAKNRIKITIERR